ncbi:hypothetical protein B0H19DRAFT_1256032 [Mycena capillaripes]|nr:hypothetical protein B0H19DRAFT_1256032 [Mycena capillaripes]
MEGTGESPVNQPRAYLDGIEFPKDFVLPLPEADAVRSRDMRKRTKEYENMAVLSPLGSAAINEHLPLHLRLAIIFNMQLPNLFQYSYAVQKEDVPEDLLDDCIWALSLFIRMMEDCSEHVLRTLGHLVGTVSDYQHSKYLTLLNARGKIASHLLRADRPLEAIPYAKAMVEEECSRGDERWLKNPAVFGLYGETLVFTRTDDDEAVKMLRRALLGIESPNWPGSGYLHPIRTRTFLSRALGNIGADDKAKIHETFVIEWFDKNPTLMLDKGARYLLLPPGPILEALGGEKWLETRENTSKTAKRLTKACRACKARGPLVKLSLCSSCLNIFYCSRECQKSHWEHHKVSCREMAANQEEIERMNLTDPLVAKLAADWSSWLKLNNNINQFGMIHALGLHRNLKRGRTHIVVKKVKYVATATKLTHRFRVVSCGVFLIKDVLHDIETLLSLDRGKGQEYVDSLLHELDAIHAKVPYIDLSFGDGIPASLGSGATSIDSIRAEPYDRAWRKKIHADPPPGSLKLESGAKDVENIF